ncbi:MAG: hypothetical protein JWR80_6367 [Bradyrhizobium sp.]|nr:hypothetical protein [Bradyrhizobium sp.]
MDLVTRSFCRLRIAWLRGGYVDGARNIRVDHSPRVVEVLIEKPSAKPPTPHWPKGHDRPPQGGLKQLVHSFGCGKTGLRGVQTDTETLQFRDRQNDLRLRSDQKGHNRVRGALCKRPSYSRRHVSIDCKGLGNANCLFRALLHQGKQAASKEFLENSALGVPKCLPLGNGCWETAATMQLLIFDVPPTPGDSCPALDPLARRDAENGIAPAIALTPWTLLEFILQSQDDKGFYSVPIFKRARSQNHSVNGTVFVSNADKAFPATVTATGLRIRPGRGDPVDPQR